MAEGSRCPELSMGPTSVQIAIVCITLAVITTSGNLLIIVAVCRDPLKELRTTSNYLIVNLAVADIFVGLVGESIMALQHWFSWGEKAYAPTYFGVEASCFAVVALTVERFIVIEFPLSNVELLAPSRLKICISVTWIISMILALLPFMGWNSTPQYRLFLFDVMGFFFLIILFGLYIRMFVVMRRYNRSLLAVVEVNNENVQSIQSSGAARAREHEVTKAIFLFFGVYMLCWTPSVVIENINFFKCRTDDDYEFIQNACKFAGLMNSAVNPLLYGLRMRTFRRAVRGLCPRCSSADDVYDDWRPLPA